MIQKDIMVLWLLFYWPSVSDCTPLVLNCTSDKIPTLLDNSLLLDDTMGTGDVLLKINDLKGKDSSCEAADILNVKGTSIVLTQPLAEYCAERLRCVFVCNNEFAPWSVVDMGIRRTQDYLIKFSNLVYTASVQEIRSIGTHVHLHHPLSLLLPGCINGTYFARETIFYTLIENGNGTFMWMAETSPDSLFVNGVIDYERNQSFSLIVKATIMETRATVYNLLRLDIEGNATTQIHVDVIDIDDNNPKFNISGEDSLYHLAIQEEDSTFVNVPLCTSPPIQAFDPDFGINATVLYSITGEIEPGLFTINRQNGSISVSRVLDRDVTSSYRLVIQATQEDRVTATATATVLVAVTDIDDNTPEFVPAVYNTAVLEHANTGAVVCLVTAFDKDEGRNADFSYILYNGSYMFTIDDSGFIKIRNSTELDREQFPGGLIYITVGTETINGEKGQHNASVIITLIDTNDNTPHFTKTTYSFDTGQGKQSSTIGQIRATDKDIGWNRNITYSCDERGWTTSCNIATRQQTLPFIIEPLSGNVVICDQLLCSTYSLLVEACDNPSNGENKRCTFATVYITNSGHEVERNRKSQTKENVLTATEIALLTVLVVLILGTATTVAIAVRKLKISQNRHRTCNNDLTLTDFNPKVGGPQVEDRAIQDSTKEIFASIHSSTENKINDANKEVRIENITLQNGLIMETKLEDRKTTKPDNKDNKILATIQEGCIITELNNENCATSHTYQEEEKKKKRPKTNSNIDGNYNMQQKKNVAKCTHSNDYGRVDALPPVRAVDRTSMTKLNEPKAAEDINIMPNQTEIPHPDYDKKEVRFSNEVLNLTDARCQSINDQGLQLLNTCKLPLDHAQTVTLKHKNNRGTEMCNKEINNPEYPALRTETSMENFRKTVYDERMFQHDNNKSVTFASSEGPDLSNFTDSHLYEYAGDNDVETDKDTDTIAERESEYEENVIFV